MINLIGVYGLKNCRHQFIFYERTRLMQEGLSKKQTVMVQGAAILMMLYHHLFSDPETLGISYISILHPGSLNIELPLAWFCKICVGLFAFVSGYGMYYSLARTNETLFLPRLKKDYKIIFGKIGHFYLKYWYVFLVSMGLVFAFSNKTFSGKEFIFNFLGLSSTYNGTWWYVLQYVKMMLVLPLADIFFTSFTNKAEILKKRCFFAVLVGIAAVCAVIGLFFYRPLLTGLVSILDSLRISFTLIFLMGYILARFQIYQYIDSIAQKQGFSPALSGAAALFAAVTVRVFLAQDASYAQLDFLIVPVFIYGFLKITDRHALPVTVFSWFGKYSSYMWFTHIFFLGAYFRPIISLTGISAGIYLTVLALSAAAAVILTHTGELLHIY